MPASSVIVVKQLWTLPCVEQEIHLMLLPPGKRLAQKLPGFVKVKVSGPQEAQHMLILWNLCRGQNINTFCHSKSVRSKTLKV